MTAASVRASFASRLLLVLCFGCSGPLDAGKNHPRGLLPVDERNPILLNNDGPNDNWQLEYALLLSALHGTQIAGLVVNASPAWPNLRENLDGWRALIAAARASGLNAPDPLPSESMPFTPPADGEIDSTPPNGSDGAQFIVSASANLAKPGRPVTIVTGGRLTDIADAYLLDHSLAERVVVVSSLGTLAASSARMSNPNGEMDPWADRIVASRLPYVQVSAYYDQLTDVPSSRLSELPANAFGAWIADKQPRIFALDVAADQVAVLAALQSEFVVDVERATVDPASASAPAASPVLDYSTTGRAWVVTAVAPERAIAEFWKGLAAL